MKNTYSFFAKNIVQKILVVLLNLFIISCSAKDFDDNDFQIKYYRNNPLPTTDSLRILAIGNSYTDDATAYLNSLITKAGIDSNRICIYVGSIGSASLQTWAEIYENDKFVNITRRAGNLEMKNNGTLKELLAQHWDIITLQQESSKAINFNTFNPWLSRIINYIKQDCSNTEVALGWQMAWSYWSNYGNAPKGKERYELICSAIKTQIKKNGIDIIIPIGTAIENARMSSLQTKHDLTRDGTHLCFGAGRYIASCIWYETLIAPVFGKSILHTYVIHSITDEEKNSSLFETVEVNNTNYLLCQKCAEYAKIYPYTPTKITIP